VPPRERYFGARAPELPGARFCKIQKIQNLNFGKIQKKILECSLPFLLSMCEFVLRNILYSFLSKNDKISDLGTHFQIWEHVSKFV
jgi:hypothetical protein